MAYLDGYEKVTKAGTEQTGEYPPFAAQGTEMTNQEKGPGPDWAKRPKKSDPGAT